MSIVTWSVIGSLPSGNIQVRVILPSLKRVTLIMTKKECLPENIEASIARVLAKPAYVGRLK